MFDIIAHNITNIKITQDTFTVNNELKYYTTIEFTDIAGCIKFIDIFSATSSHINISASETIPILPLPPEDD